MRVEACIPLLNLLLCSRSEHGETDLDGLPLNLLNIGAQAPVIFQERRPEVIWMHLKSIG